MLSGDLEFQGVRGACGMGLAWPGVDRDEDRHSVVAAVVGDVPARVFDFQYLVARGPNGVAAALVGSFLATRGRR